MPATCGSRGALKTSTNRVRTSNALAGSAMWESVIGVTAAGEGLGANAGVEALIHAPSRGGGRAAAQERRRVAGEAVLASGAFDSGVTSYEQLMEAAKAQGAVGEGAGRGACRVCGQIGHLTKQCRNQFSKYFTGGAAGGGAAGAARAAAGGAPPAPGEDSGLDDILSDGSGSSDSDSEAARKERRKERKRKERKREKKERRRQKEKRRESKKRSDKKRRRSSSSSSSSDSD
jgi:hypothetical protein